MHSYYWLRRCVLLSPSRLTNLGRERPPREEQPTNTIQIKQIDSHPWLSIINVSDPCGRSCMLQAGALKLQESRVQD